MVHIQRLMMALIRHYCDRELWPALVIEAIRREGEGMNSDTLVTTTTRLKLLQICANIIDYCRSAMTMGGAEFSSPYCRIIFTPDLSATLLTNQNKDTSTGPHPFTTSHLTSPWEQSLGYLIRQLKEISEGYTTALEMSRELERKIDHTPSLTQDEILQLVSITGSSLPRSQQQALARRKLKQTLKATEKERKILAYIVENLLYLLWRHLQFYLVHCKPVGGVRDVRMGGVTFTRPTIRRMGEPSKVTAMETTFDLSSLSDGVSASDVEMMKSSIARCLPNSLFKQLLDLEENHHHQWRHGGGVGFIESLVHRIRKLIKLKATQTPSQQPFTL